MRIVEITNRTQDLTERLLAVWESSVRATHLFLSDDEIQRIKEYVPQALSGVAHLVIAEDETGRPVAFMGIEDGTLEMLFITPEERGKGYGRLMIEYVRSKYADTCRRILAGTGDSPLTLPFYKKCGFSESHRVKDFFTDHYDHPIFEGGKRLTDMVYLSWEYPED